MSDRSGSVATVHDTGGGSAAVVVTLVQMTRRSPVGSPPRHAVPEDLGDGSPRSLERRARR